MFTCNKPLPEEPLWYIAINGSSCALAPFALFWPFEVEPVPQQMIGFPTLAQAHKAQKTCLSEPIDVVKKAFSKWASRDDVVILEADNPEPQTYGATGWTQIPKSALV